MKVLYWLSEFHLRAAVVFHSGEENRFFIDKIVSVREATPGERVAWERLNEEGFPAETKDSDIMDQH